MFSQRRLLNALNFAAVRHANHRRKGVHELPYINHLIEVAYLLASHDVDDTEVLCAAVLHDSIEDVGVTSDELSRHFGPRVAALVLEVTDDMTLMHFERTEAQVVNAGRLSVGAQNIRVADKISNLRGLLTTPPELWSLERKVAYFDWAREIVQRCVLSEGALRETFETVYESGRSALALHALPERHEYGSPGVDGD